MLDHGIWPERAAAYARYNLACYRALAGDLDDARALLRLALPGQEELASWAPKDDDLIALRDRVEGKEKESANTAAKDWLTQKGLI